MWEVLASTRDLLTGDYTATPAASAWYDGHVTVPDLEVVALSVTETLDGQTVRRTATLTVDDNEGRLVPYQGSDPLAPYGQQVGVSVGVSAGGDVDSIPVGRFLIAAPESDGSWIQHLGHALPTGGSVTLQLQDILQDLLESEIPGLMQPASTSVATEIKRLCAGICPVNVEGVTGTLDAEHKGAIYDPVRMTALLSILPADLIIRASRGSMAEFFTLPSTVSKLVTVAEGEWISASMNLDRDGIFNVVVTTSDQADSRISGIASEVAGPFSASGPLRPRIYRHSSPLYTTQAQAQAGATTRLASLLASRSMTVTARLPFDPTVDAGDLHTLSLVPGSLEPLARVQSLTWSPFEAEMTIRYSVTRQEVESWTRPADLLPN